MARQRLDARVLLDGLAKDVRTAAGLIMSGAVLVNDRPIDKPGAPVRSRDVVRLRNSHTTRRFVSRGGDKLDGALSDLGVTVDGLRCMDVGASTGGFTDCLLGRGASDVIAVDVGYGLLADTLRRDPRVHVHERTNARHMTAAAVPYRPALIVVDASFISLRALLPGITAVAAETAQLVAMVKPQFELPRGEVPAGGVVRDDGARQRAVDDVVRAAQSLGWRHGGEADSRVAGPSGNRERFVLLMREER